MSLVLLAVAHAGPWAFGRRVSDSIRWRWYWQVLPPRCRRPCWHCGLSRRRVSGAAQDYRGARDRDLSTSQVWDSPGTGLSAPLEAQAREFPAVAGIGRIPAWPRLTWEVNLARTRLASA
jgi:hypothetical protein